MYDLSSKFNAFYNSHVVLSQTEQNKLYQKKDINLQRLKDGLKEYNEEYGTSYSVVDSSVQGSVAMSTVVQNEDHDYDIDVGANRALMRDWLFFCFQKKKKFFETTRINGASHSVLV